jgi:SAM-dependent methyltransferase
MRILICVRTRLNATAPGFPINSAGGGAEVHLSNLLFWNYCSRKYPRYFKDPSVLEVGSYDVNGSVRTFFERPVRYVGVDWRPGPGVDQVSLAHEMSFEEPFDVVISASMLEHDRHWQRSLSSMVKHLKEDGILFLSWGGALNPTHDLDTADDGCFHSLPAGQVISHLETLGIHVHEFRYEGLQFPRECMGDGMGEVCLVAFRDKKFAPGESHLDGLLPGDKATEDTPAKEDAKDDSELRTAVVQVSIDLKRIRGLMYDPHDVVRIVNKRHPRWPQVHIWKKLREWSLLEDDS